MMLLIFALQNSVNCILQQISILTTPFGAGNGKTGALKVNFGSLFGIKGFVGTYQVPRWVLQKLVYSFEKVQAIDQLISQMDCMLEC